MSSPKDKSPEISPPYNYVWNDKQSSPSLKDIHQITSFKPSSRTRESVFHVDDATSDDESENDFSELSTDDDIKHSDSLLVSSKSALKSDQIWIATGITGLHIFSLMTIWA